jgi:hypothetical protein
MNSRAHPQQGFRSVLGIMSLKKTYGDERLEAACQKALDIKAKSYSSLKSILKNNLDKENCKSKAVNRCCPLTTTTSGAKTTMPPRKEM